MSEHGLAANVLSDVVLPFSLAIITLGIGLGLTGADFRRVIEMPRAVGAGIFAQVVVLPVLALGVAYVSVAVFGLAHELALGLLLLACCPGGATSNLVTWLARADAALSVTLTSVVSLASAAVTPFVFVLSTQILLGSSASVTLSFVDMATLVFAIVVLPILLGMLLRRHRPVWASRLEGPLRIASIALLAVLVVAIIAANSEGFWGLAARAVPSAVALNLLALAAGFGIAHLVRLPQPQARAISIEVGFQNATLGIAIAITQLGSPLAAIVPGFYGLAMFISGGALAWWWARTAAPLDPEAAEAPADA